MKNIFSKNKIKYISKKDKLLIFSLLFYFFLAVTIKVYATPPTSPYQAGDTLDPTCAPGDTNCYVEIIASQTGNSGKYLTTDGTTTSWTTVSGGLSNIVDDTTPQLGGNLDLNGNVITGLEIGTNIQAYNSKLSDFVSSNLAITTNTLSASSGAITMTPASGSSLNINLATTGDLVVNTDDLVVDTSTGYVGVGTASPGYQLDVNGTMRISGNVTLAASEPHISSPRSAIILGDESGGGYFFYQYSGSIVHIGTGSASNFVFDGTGNVGIGDSTPAAAFTVGSGDLFQVNSSGAIAAATGITSSGAYLFTADTSTDSYINLTSTGDFLIKDSGTAIATFADNGAITFAPTSGQNLTANLSGGGIFNVDGGQTLLGGTTLSTGTLAKLNIVSTMASSGSTTAIAGIHGDYTFNNGGSSSYVQVGNRFVFNNAPTTNANTMVGEILRTIDNTTLANLVRGMEVTSNAGSNTAGTNTGIRTTGGTFGIQAITNASAGSVSLPAAIYGENTGTTQGDVLRLYSSSVTSAPSFATFYHNTSTFTGTGLLMDLASSSGAFTGNFVDFKNAGTSRFKIESTGKTNITTDIVDYSAYIFNDGNATTRSGLLIQAGLDDHTTAGPSTLVGFQDGNGTAVGSITFGSSVTAYNTTSDRRLKENITDSTLSLEKLMQVKIHDYTWIADPEHKISYGVLAQELYDIYPLAVTKPVDENVGTWMVDYSKLTPFIIKGVQDLSLHVDDINTTLGNDISSIKTNDENINFVLNNINVDITELKASIDSSDSNIEELQTSLALLQDDISGINENNTNTQDRVTALETLLSANVFTGLENIQTDKFTSSGEAVFNGLNFFNGTTQFNSGVVFGSNVEFNTPPIFNNDTAGFAVVKKGSRKVEVLFDTPYVATPVVNTTISFEEGDNVSESDADQIFADDIKSLVINKSQNGFTIILNKNATRDIRFSWNALQVKDAKIFESLIPGLIIDEPTVVDPIPETDIAPTENTTPTDPIPETDVAPTENTTPTDPAPELIIEEVIADPTPDPAPVADPTPTTTPDPVPVVGQ